MKIKQPGEPPDDGFYALPRGMVLEVLARNYVSITREREFEERYRLELEDKLFVFSLPPVVPIRMVLRLAAAFNIRPDEFYLPDNSRLH